MTPRLCASLKSWNSSVIGDHYIYSHPDLDLSTDESVTEKTKAALLGYMIDPDHPTRTNKEILNKLVSQAQSVDEIAGLIHSMAGRFVLFFKNREDTFVFHDACGLRSVYYTKREDGVYLGSQPGIFEKVIHLKSGAKFESYHQSAFKNHLEPWLPCDCTLFDNLHQLIPNHYLKLSTTDQIRYWPGEHLRELGLEEGAGKTALLMKGLLEGGNSRFGLAMPLTAGWDSRLLLAASREIANDIYFYTLLHGDLETWSSDIKIPGKLLRSLGLKHHIIDCQTVSNPEFDRVYDKTYLSHNSWRTMAYGMLNAYPAEMVSIKGNGSEICRCFFYKSGVHEPVESAGQLIRKRKGWEELPFVYDQLSGWLAGANKAAAETGVNIWDLFYWEHRMGGWQAQYQLEWDIIHETYSPYNHRGLIETMLGVSAEFRCYPEYTLYKKAWKILWPEVMKLPVNPPSTLRVRARHRLIGVLGVLGLKNSIRGIYRKYNGIGNRKTA